MPIVRPDPYYLEGKRAGLHPKEYDFLQQTFYRGVDSPEVPQYIKHMVLIYSKNSYAAEQRAEQILENLIEKEILSVSPDHTLIRLTDLGIESYKDFTQSQNEWLTKDIISINEGKSEINIKKGEKFKGIKSLRDILALAESEIIIEDPYIGANVFDILYEIHRDSVKVQILTSNNKSNIALNSAIVSYLAYKSEVGNIEMKFGNSSDMHERLIIIDKKTAYVFTASTKDLGTKDSTIKLINNVETKLASFSNKWVGSMAVTTNKEAGKTPQLSKIESIIFDLYGSLDDKSILISSDSSGTHLYPLGKVSDPSIIKKLEKYDSQEVEANFIDLAGRGLLNIHPNSSGSPIYSLGKGGFTLIKKKK